MADSPHGKTPSGLHNNENFQVITGVDAPERLALVRVAIASALQQVHALNEQITHEMDRLGLPLPTDQDES